ncbi:SpoIIE family protein phosphatase [bacterium]|nr:SpoIIE family protein phosphatase [bacterium]
MVESNAWGTDLTTMAYVKLLNQSGVREFDLNDMKLVGGPKEKRIGRNAVDGIHTVGMGSSGAHGVIRFDGRNFTIVDEGSRNGTYLKRRRGVPVREERLVLDRPYVLQHGDELELGRPDHSGHLDRIRFYDGPIEIGPDNSSAVENPQAEIVLSVLDRTDSDNLRAAFDGILKISRILATHLQIEEMAKELMEQMPIVFPKGQRFMLFATVPNTRFLRLLARKSKGRRKLLSGDEDDDPTYSKTIYRQVVEERSAVIYTDMGNQNMAASIMEMEIRSIICAPVEAPDGRVLGMLQVDTDQRDRFMKSDLDVLKVIAQQVGAAMQMAELHSIALLQAQSQSEMKHAGEIASMFLPRGVPVVEGFEFWADYQPCEEVGGDFYHFTKVDSDRLAIGVCDVVGHGVSAALIMANLSGELKNMILTQRDPCDTLERLDAVFTPILNPPDSLNCRFFTISLAFLNVHDGTMQVTNGGHPYLVIRRADGKLEFPDRELSGRAIAMDFGDDYKELNRFETATVKLNPGDVAVYYSDGLIEADDIHRKPFGGLEDLRTFGDVVARTEGGPKAVGQAIMKRFKEFTAGAKISDDVTLVCFGPKPDFRPVSA